MQFIFLAVTVMFSGGPRVVPCSNSKEAKCIEYDNETHKAVVRGLESAKAFRDQVRLYQGKVKELESVDRLWKKRSLFWKQERASMKRIQEYTAEQNKVYAKRVSKLESDNKKLRDSMNSVWRHPALWASIGLVVGVIVAVVVIQTIRPIGGSSNTVSLRPSLWRPTVRFLPKQVQHSPSQTMLLYRVK